MSAQTWMETLTAAQSAGTALTNTLTATSLLPTANKITLPNNYFNVPGKAFRLVVVGAISNLVTTPGTLTLDMRLGAVVAYNGGAMQMSSTAHTTVPFVWTSYFTCRSIGSGTSATGIGQGTITSQALSLTAVADSTTTPATLLTPNSTPAVGTGFDSTSALTVDIFGTFSIANAANLVQIQQYMVESLN